MFKLRALLAVGLSLYCFSVDAGQIELLNSEANLRVTLDFSRPNNKVPPEITWQVEDFRLEAPSTLFLKGNLLLQGSLTLNTQPVPVNETDRSFQLEIPLTQDSMEFELIYMSIDGKTGKETISSKKNHQQPNSEAQPTPSRWSFSAGLIPTYSVTFRSEKADFRIFAMEYRAKTDYQFHPKWSAHAEVRNTLTPFSQSLTDTNGRFLNLRGIISYALKTIGTRWLFSIQGGAFYSALITAPNSFGYQNVWGPQISPHMGFQASSRSTVNGYLKYSLIMGAIQLSNYELGGGINWVYKLPQSTRSLVTSFDVSTLSVRVDQAVLVYSISLGVGLRF